jgi:hypothetical protein
MKGEAGEDTSNAAWLTYQTSDFRNVAHVRSLRAQTVEIYKAFTEQSSPLSL